MLFDRRCSRPYAEIRWFVLRVRQKVHGTLQRPRVRRVAASAARHGHVLIVSGRSVD